MNPATLPAAWAHQQPPARGTAVRPADGATSAEGAAAWVLQRRCSLRPAQFAACFAGLVLVSALVAAFFWVLGAPVITVFAGVDVLLVGLAFAWHAVHAADGERLALAGADLQVERRCGLRTTVEHWPLSGLRFTQAADGSIELARCGRRATLGRDADDVQRQRVLAALRLATPPLTE